MGDRSHALRGNASPDALRSGVGSRFLDPAGTPEQSAFYEQIVGDIESTLRQHLSAFDESRFADAVKLLGKARMIHAFGMGGCSTLCSDELQVRLVRLGYPIAVCHDPVMMRVTAASLGAANTTLNVAALVGHTALRSNHLDDLFRTATADEISAMREQLRESLEAGALGLSTGLAYANAFSASTEEVMQLTEELTAFGAVYTTHLRSEFEPVLEAMDEADVRRILAHPLSMVGSDGLPEDPFPHPRLWGAFPRVLGHFSRDVRLFALHTAVHKMTGLSAARFGLKQRGEIREGYWADLVLFDPATIRDVADFNDPQRAAEGIDGVWVNGVLSYSEGQANGRREGRFLAREGDLRKGFH